MESRAGTILVFNVQNSSSPVLVGSNSAHLSDEPQGITILVHYLHVAEYNTSRREVY